MTYVSYTFAAFAAITLLLYYKIPKRYQWQVLLTASIIFYLCSGPIFFLYLLLFSFVSWFGAGKLEEYRLRGENSVRRLKLLLAGLCLFNLGILFFVKWIGMELALVNRLFGTNFAWRFILPMGMSFFTFQNVSYVTDVYRGKISAEKKFLHYLLYSCYFPYIVSGPVNRYGQMERRLFSGHDFETSAFYQGVLRILWGYLKKMVIADRAAVFVNEVFDNYYMYRGLFVLFAVVLFTLQLYMDFSGCMDIVLGLSKLFGIEMTENFHAPFGAATTAEFWRRWHVSLTSWFRDYLYIPLGGGRKGKIIKYRNIMIVFLFCGMWHGAGITFLVWGFLNGMYQVAGEMTSEIRKKINGAVGLKENGVGAVLRKRLITFMLGEFAWLFFRAGGIREAFAMLRRLFTGWNPWILTDKTLVRAGLDVWDFCILAAGTACVGLASHFNQKKDLHGVFLRQSWLCRFLVILTALVVWYLFGIYGPGLHASAFIYYNF